MCKIDQQEWLNMNYHFNFMAIPNLTKIIKTNKFKSPYMDYRLRIK